ncbi:MAG: tyrosine-type recombinase/integrase, partial [candidate division Zixibacteria bacterium]|nr:tyrosine-type recombinase/integrase [candidate division Zixibacteria bacterium]
HVPARSFERQRNYLIVNVFWDTMIRRRELLRLKMDDLNLTDGILKIHGKGRKQRYVPMGTNTIRLLHKYINFHRKRVISVYLFCYRSGEPNKAQIYG